MKIAFTCNRIGAGGAERVICNLSNKMVNDGNDVLIICLDILEGFHYFIDKNVQLIQIDENYKEHRSFLTRKFAGIKNLFGLMKKLIKEKPDIVISFYTRQNCYAILVCRLLGIPVIASERDHFFTCDSKVNQLMRRVFYPRANGFIHQTHWAKNFLRECCSIKIPDLVLPNPVWIKNYPKRKVVPNRIISVGRLEEQKNYKGLLRAFTKVKAAIPSATLYIYGEGIQRKELEKLIDELGMSTAVTLCGNSDRILECYAQADVFVLFSHGEGYPNVLMEAMAVGVPCISSNCLVGGPADMIVNGENGVLVEVDNEVELAKELVNLLGNQELKHYFSRNAVSIRETNDFNKIYFILMSYIDKVIERHGIH